MSSIGAGLPLVNQFAMINEYEGAGKPDWAV